MVIKIQLIFSNFFHKKRLRIFKGDSKNRMIEKYRYKITIEYDGRCFHGWQSQSHPVHGVLTTVQGLIQKAVFKITGQTVLVEGAGRTDAGVHATGQVGHFDLTTFYPVGRLLDALNFYMRDQGCVVLKVESVPLTFHARFSAFYRTYHYQIVNRRAPLALDQFRAWHVISPLDVKAMDQAAQHLVGHHDFSAFRASECQGKTPFKTLTRFTFQQEGERIIAIIQARSFLHNQVRIMMGTLKKIGEGKWAEEDLIRIRDEKKRELAGPTAPAWGLCLVDVGYEDPS